MDFAQIRDVFVEVLGCDADAVTPQALLREDLGADSLAAVELCMALEEACGVYVDDAVLPTLRTVDDVLEYWKDHQDHME